MGTKMDRNTLKGYFKKGATPKGEDFEVLIESILNLKDDDIVRFSSDESPVFLKKTGENGGTILEVYQKPSGSESAILQWMICLDSMGNLSVKLKNGTEAVVRISKNGAVEVKGSLLVNGEMTLIGDLKIAGDVVFTENCTGVYNHNYNNVIEYRKRTTLKENEPVEIFKFGGERLNNELLELKVIANEYFYYGIIFCSFSDNKILLTKLASSGEALKLQLNALNIVLHSNRQYSLDAIIQISKITNSDF